MSLVNSFIFLLLFGVLSLASYSAGVHEPLRFICESSVSPKYKAFVEECLSKQEFPTDKIFEFATGGERSAIRTLVDIYPPNEKEQLLRDLVNLKVKAAIPILGRILHDQQRAECLQWYAQSEDVHKIDPDFRNNYAHALLILQKDKQAVDKAWELLVAWEKEDMRENEEDKICLYGVYTLLFKTAKMLDHADFVIKYVESMKSKPVRYKLRDSFIETFEGTPFINLIAKQTGILLVRLTLDEILKKGHIANIIKAVLDRNNEYDENVTSIVVGKISGLLQDVAVRNIPGKIIPNFDCTKIKREHLVQWARELINTRREELIRYVGNDIVLKTQFAQLSNYMLEQLVVSAFEQIFYLSDEHNATP